MTSFFIHCIGSQKQGNEPPKFNVAVTENRGGETFVSTYPISIENAIKLRQELSDFLAANNVPVKS